MLLLPYCSISKNFLASQYVATIEQPKIIDRYQRGKLNIIPVLVSGELPAGGFLSRLQFLNGNHPLDKCDDAKIKELIAALENAIRAFKYEIEMTDQPLS